MGGAQAGLGFTGEWYDPALGMVYLRARWYAPGVGRFTQPDPYPCPLCLSPTLSLYIYADNHPINRTDPTGLFPFPWEWPAWLVVELARAAYWKVGPLRFCLNHPDDGQHPSDTVDDLFTDFVCEYGPAHRYFYADAHLTQQLARSYTVHLYRVQFYLQGGGMLSGQHEFEVPGFLLATLDSLVEGDETHFLIRIPQLNITHFLGTFKYEIADRGRSGLVRFWVYNKTDLASGTRLPRILGGTPGAPSLEELIEDHPELRNEPIGSLLQCHPISSILRARARWETVGLQGGGTMEQTFIWCERPPRIRICSLSLPLPFLKPDVLYWCQ